MKCKCGAIMNEKAKFCGECGEAAPKPEMQVVEQKVLDPILTIEDLCKLFKASRSTVEQLIEDADDPIPSFRMTPNNPKSHKRFVAEDVLIWCKRQQEKQRG